MLQVQERGNVDNYNPIGLCLRKQENVKDAGAVAKEIQDLIERINRAVRSEKVMRVALTTLMAVHKPRIYAEGLDANNQQIGTYSTKPISISRKRQARDTGQTRFDGGYAQYKSMIGKGGNVNLRDTDQMMMDYQIIQNGGQWGFGFQNTENFNKSQWLQDKYDKDIFDVSNKELDLLGDTHQSEVEKLL